MATFISAVPSMGDATLPTNAGELIRGSQWGIDSTLSGYIIQDVSIQKNVVTDVTQDQKGAEVSELDYDTTWNGSMTVIGGDGDETATIPGISVGMLDFTWAGTKWKVDSVTYRGNYASKKMYDITFHRTKHFPAST